MTWGIRQQIPYEECARMGSLFTVVSVKTMNQIRLIIYTWSAIMLLISPLYVHLQQIIKVKALLLNFMPKYPCVALQIVLATLANKIFLILVHHAFGLRRGQCTSFLPIMDYVGPSRCRQNLWCHSLCLENLEVASLPAHSFRTFCCLPNAISQ